MIPFDKFEMMFGDEHEMARFTFGGVLYRPLEQEHIVDCDEPYVAAKAISKDGQRVTLRWELCDIDVNGEQFEYRGVPCGSEWSPSACYVD